MDAELKQYLDEFSERTDAQFRLVREEMATEFRQVREENARFREETTAEFQQMREGTATEFQRVREEIATAKNEMKLHFDSTADRFESNFELLSEGIRNIDQKLGREAADIRTEMRQGFADTHALIRFSLKLPARRRGASRRPTPPPRPGKRPTKR